MSSPTQPGSSKYPRRTDSLSGTSILTHRTINLFNVKLDDEEHQEQEDHDPKNRKEKRYATPVAEFIDKARDKLKITVREFKF
jgi:hypothetical protein